MNAETENTTQTFDSSTETVGLRLRQETEIESISNKLPTDELTLRSVDQKIKQTTDLILRRVGERCIFLAIGPR